MGNTKKIKPKKCKVCKETFTPMRPLQMVCSPKCGYEYAKSQKQKEWKKEKKKRKEKLKTRSEHLNDLQRIFNKYIRLRDKDKPCVSCGRYIDKTNTHASHYFSVGAYPNLRFNEDNVHASCDHCNLHLHGNIAEYSIRLPDRIGIERFEALKNSRNGNPLKLTVDEIKDLINKYKEKAKSLSK